MHQVRVASAKAVYSACWLASSSLGGNVKPFSNYVTVCEDYNIRILRLLFGIYVRERGSFRPVE